MGEKWESAFALWQWDFFLGGFVDVGVSVFTQLANFIVLFELSTAVDNIVHNYFDFSIDASMPAWC